jgi:hypothetical protein
MPVEAAVLYDDNACFLIQVWTATEEVEVALNVY